MRKKFSTLSSINPKDPTTWENRIFLTFDIDWAHDKVLNETIDLVETADAGATWFITHDTPVLHRLRENSKFEIGLHPNFNFLLNGDYSNGRNANEIVQRLHKLAPDSKSIRSHSMTQNSYLLDLFIKEGLTHESNHFIPYHTGIELRPWELWNGLVRVPYGWEDDICCTYEKCGNTQQQSPLDIVNNRVGIKVFDFHPIHIFLNTESLVRYESTRPIHQNPKELIKHRYSGYGTRSRLIELLELMKNS